ncbi:MAG TPA: Ig-like domain-containing protein, partial [Silvibacterium sp.]|nr:Ig-like domain-containing protein [Silvibacterium sp.]
LNYQDGESHVWHGNAAMLVFAWQNNMGTVVTETDSGVNWMHCPLSDGTVFGVGCGLGMANGAHFALPSAAGDGSTLQAIASPSGFDIVDHPAHGVKACLLDGSNNVVIEFEDGTEGHVWNGTADVFGLFCTPASGAPALVVVTPASASIPAGAQQQFTAVVENNANQSVTWSVDGIAGGNTTVGLIDATGLYSAPVSSGNHTITATSVAVPTASGSAPIAVTGGDPGGPFTVVED